MHRDSLAKRHRFDLVVRDVDRRDAEALVQPGDLTPHRDAQLGVEIGERLVHQKRPSARGPSPGRWRRVAAARRRVRPACGARRSSSPSIFGRPRITRWTFSLAILRSFSPNAEVLGDGHVRVEGVVLEDHRDVSLARGERRSRVVAEDIVRTSRSSSPAIIRSAVVLPQPEGPTSTMNSPSTMSRLTSSTALTPPSKTLLMCSSLTPDGRPSRQRPGLSTLDQPLSESQSPSRSPQLTDTDPSNAFAGCAPGRGRHNSREAHVDQIGGRASEEHVDHARLDDVCEVAVVEAELSDRYAKRDQLRLTGVERDTHEVLQLDRRVA